jgi:hypothetical protein
VSASYVSHFPATPTRRKQAQLPLSRSKTKQPVTMKIANAALIFLSFEGARVSGFSAYLNALTGPAAYAKSSYAISQSNPPPAQPTQTGSDYLNGISGPESVLKAPANDYLGSAQQPNGYGAQPTPITASTAATGASYLNSMSAGTAAAAPKPASYSPFGSKPKAVESSGNSYLSNIADAPPVQYTPPPLPRRKSSLRVTQRLLRSSQRRTRPSAVSPRRLPSRVTLEV